MGFDDDEEGEAVAGNAEILESRLPGLLLIPAAFVRISPSSSGGGG